MKILEKKIGKITSKGQITLPSLWRKGISTNQVLMESKGDYIEIHPLYVKSKKEIDEYTVFDAIRDNKGRGIKASNLLDILKKIK